jgi:hypothetical protein
VSKLGPTVSEQCLQERLDRLRASYANRDDLVRELERYVRNAPDDQIVRINPIQYAAMLRLSASKASSARSPFTPCAPDNSEPSELTCPWRYT